MTELAWICLWLSGAYMLAVGKHGKGQGRAPLLAVPSPKKLQQTWLAESSFNASWTGDVQSDAGHTSILRVKTCLGAYLPVANAEGSAQPNGDALSNESKAS